MKSSSSSFSANLGTNGLTANILRRGVLRQLAGLRNGQLVVIERVSAMCSARTTR